MIDLECTSHLKQPPYAFLDLLTNTALAVVETILIQRKYKYLKLAPTTTYQFLDIISSDILLNYICYEIKISSADATW